MTKIKDINAYINAMHKSIEDKLWFKRFLDMPIFSKNTVVIDYGCADGTLLDALSLMYPNIEFFWI